MLAGAIRVLSEVRAIRRDHGISYRTQWREYRRFARETGMVRAEFLRYWLWDVRRPLHQRMAFISSREKVPAEPLMNPPAAAHQVRDKGWATAQLDAAGVPTSEVLALVALHADDTAFSSSPTYPIIRDVEGLQSLLGSAPQDGVVFKPTRGGGGDSVYVFGTAGRDELVALDGTVWRIDRLIHAVQSEAPEWKVERRHRPHPVLRAISGETLGTIRMLAFRMQDGTVHIGPASWKIPVNDSGLDHYMHSEGAFAAFIDPDTGRLGPARRWVSMQHIDHHPVTGARITGVTMPFWADAVRVVRQATACFPDIGAPAYDIGITPDGPVVIEVNTNWAEHLTQAPHPMGLVSGAFRQFLEERGCGGVVNLAARDRGVADSTG